MSDIDPLVPALTGLVVDLTWFLDSCDDDTLNPDDAVKMLESVVCVFHQLPQEQRVRFLQVLRQIAEAETDPGRRTFLEEFPESFDLLDDQQ